MYVTVMMIDILTYGIIAGAVLLFIVSVNWVFKMFTVKKLTKELVDADETLELTKLVNDDLANVNDELVNTLHGERTSAGIEASKWQDEVVTVPVTIYKDIVVRTRK